MDESLAGKIPVDMGALQEIWRRLMEHPRKNEILIIFIRVAIRDAGYDPDIWLKR